MIFFRKKKKKPPKMPARVFSLPERSRNNWPTILDDLDVGITIESRDDRLRADTPAGFMPVEVSAQSDNAEVRIGSAWSSEQRYGLILQFDSIEKDLQLAKEIEAVLLKNDCEGESPPLSEFDQFLEDTTG